MRRHRRFFPTRARSGKTRKFEWSRTNYSLGAAASVDHFDLLSGFRTRLGGITQNLPDWTLVRLKGAMTFEAAQAATMNTGMIAVGAIRWRSDGVGLPTPVSLPFEDWLMWTPVWTNNVAGSFPNGQALLEIPFWFDNKSMRKLFQVDDTIFLVWESNNGAVTYKATGLISAGFKLS